MNQVCLIGRLTCNPEVRYTTGTQMAVAVFTLAIDRGKDKDEKTEGQTLFPSKSSADRLRTANDILPKVAG